MDDDKTKVVGIPPLPDLTTGGDAPNTNTSTQEPAAAGVDAKAQTLAGDASTAQPAAGAPKDGAKGAAPTDAPKDAPVLDQEALNTHLHAQVRAEGHAKNAYDKAMKAAGEDAARIADAKKVYEDAMKSADRLGKIEGDAAKATYTEFVKKSKAAFESAVPNVGKIADAAAHVSRNSLAYAGGAAALALGAAMMGKKEVQKDDGTTEKKTGLFAKAVIALGAIVAVGAAVNKFKGAETGFIGKYAAKILAEKANGAAAARG
jgi:hypothetical protein